MSDNSRLNRSEDYELDYILRDVLGKRGTEDNREILAKIEKDFKKLPEVTEQTDKTEFYKYAKKHDLFKNLEKKSSK